jgi:hypothetical protein
MLELDHSFVKARQRFVFKAVGTNRGFLVLFRPETKSCEERTVLPRGLNE